MNKFIKSFLVFLFVFVLLSISCLYATWSYANEEAKEQNNNINYELSNWNVFYNNILNWDNIDTKITTGVNGDNIGTLGDGQTNYDGSNKNLRWTTWDEQSNGSKRRGEKAILELGFGSVYSLKEIDFYHFIDAGGCDFPEEIVLYYLNINNEYIKIENISITRNYSNEKRRSSDNVFVMNIDDVSTTFTWSYKGKCPISYYKFSESILAKGIKIEVKAKTNWYIGFTEIQFIQ